MQKKKLAIAAAQVFASLAVLCYFLLSPAVASSFYNQILFLPQYPTRYEKESYDSIKQLQGVPKQELFIPTSNGEKLHAWLFKIPNAKRVVLMSHGNASNIANRVGLADDLLQLNTSVLLYDYQGYGLSTGSPTVENICADGTAAFDYLVHKLGYANRDIIVYGESLGCAVSCEVAKRRDCAGIVLQSGFSSLKDISEEKLALLYLYPEVLFPSPHLNNVAILSKQHAPLLIVHGSNDEVIPVSHAQNLYAHALEPKKLVIMPNSGHCVEEVDHPLFMSELKKFLHSLPAESSASKLQMKTAISLNIRTQP